MKDHLVIINSPKHSPALYFERLVEQLHTTEQFADIPVLILTDVFPDGLPASLREQGVVHYHAESSDRDALEAVNPDQAKAVIILARDEYSRISDSVTLDVILQLKALYGDTLPYTVAECVHEDNRRRALSVGASTTLRPVRAYPEMLVRSLVAPGTEKILENLFTHHDDHAMRYAVPVENAVWADVACRLMNAGLGTLMAYVGDDETVVCHPAHDHQFSAGSLILMVREEAIPSEQAIRDCLAKRS